MEREIVINRPLCLMFAFIIIFVILIFITLTPNTVNASVENVSVSAASGSAYLPTNTAGNTSINAGGVREVNLSALPSTSRWAGFYGSISASVVLADANNNWFMNWTVSNVSGALIYASPSNSPNFMSLEAATDVDMPSWLTSTNAADNYANTFNAHELATFNGQSIDANYAFTYNKMGYEVFKTYSLKDSSSNLIWAALAQNDATGYNGNTVDYQLLVPVNDQTPTTYYFFLELP